MDRLKKNTLIDNIEISISDAAPKMPTDISKASVEQRIKMATKLMDDALGMSVSNSVSVKDGSFNNSRLKLGISDINLNSGEYFTDMITFDRMTIIELYHGNWIFRRIIDRVAQDMWSHGIAIKSDADPVELENVYKRLNRLNSQLIYGREQARLFGGAASLIMVDDGEEDLSKPLNINNINDAKEVLSIYNICFSKGDYTNEDLSIYKFKGNSVRFTVVNKDGDVIFDNETSILDNHKDREEIIEAFSNGTGTSVRFSKTLSVDMVYYATKINEDIVVRSSVPVNNIKIVTLGALKYYIAIVIAVFLLSLALAVKLVKRAIIGNYDEIGLLAQTFNNMADQLETKINDSLDKQNKLEAILESMESGVIALDNNEKIILSNPYSKKIFDLQGDVIGKKISSCVIDYDFINFKFI